VVLASICVVIAAAFYWRLSQGPVELGFLTTTVQSRIGRLLPGVRAEISGVVLERDAESGEPRIRLRDIKLRDEYGNMIAAAPRAAVGVEGRALLAGGVNLRRLELIGPRILVRRKLDGSFQLGFGDPEAAPGGKGDHQGAVPPPAAVENAPNAIDVLMTQMSPRGGSAMAALEAVHIRQASLSVYDEANRAVWYAPQANLIFRRADYGFVLFTDARISSGAEPWRTEVVTTYRSESKTFNVSARIFDLVPADIADEVFALSQLAQVKLPLSGHAEIEFAEGGKILRGSAELSARAGRVGFPNYLADPILIDEGLIRVDYDPASGGLVIGNSSLLVDGRKASLAGRVDPRRDASGRLEAYAVAFSAKNINMDAFAGSHGLSLDSFDFKGVASIGERQLVVDDLVMMSGNTAVRLRGKFIGGSEAIGVYLAGRVRDLPEPMLKHLWPGVVAPGARSWFLENVTGGRISEGEFRIALPGDVLAAAFRRVPIPDEMVDMRFTAENVAGTYFKPLPPVSGVSLKARLRGNTFAVDTTGGVVTLPSGKRLAVRNGSMRAHDLAPTVTPATFAVEAQASAEALRELIDSPPFELATKAGLDGVQLNGNATVKFELDAKLGQGVPPEPHIRALTHIEDASFSGAVDGFDFSEGKIDIEVDDNGVKAHGPVIVGGQKASISWARSFNSTDKRDEVILDATLDDMARRKLGFDVSGFVQGPIKARVSGLIEGRKLVKADIDADLSRAYAFLDVIGWSRPPTAKTLASLSIDLTSPKAIVIKDLKISGKDLKIQGNIRIAPDGGIVEGTLPVVNLDDQTQVGLGIKTVEGVLNLSITGTTFDARRLISQMFMSSAPPPTAGIPVTVQAAVNRVYANRGEVIDNLNGQLEINNGVVQRADLTGQFISGGPVTLKITSGTQGTREMRVVGRDAGAALRASNLYSKVAGGSLEFSAVLDAGAQSGIQRGLLVIRNFEVRNEVALSNINEQDRAKKPSGPRRDGLAFSRLTLPFSADQRFVRIGDALVQGPEMGASAQGIIRKVDGRMDIGGTIIPAYALNAALSEVPVLGEVLMGGRGQGVFGLNFALQGTMQDPRFVVNPVSAIAPGFLRHLFSIGGGGTNPDGTPVGPRKPLRDPRG
jgi:hypothetical protein